MNKKIVYGYGQCSGGFSVRIEKLSEDKNKYAGNYDEVPEIFSLMEPMPGAIEGFKKIAETYYIHSFNGALGESNRLE